MNDMALVATLVSPGPHCVGHGSSMPVGQEPIEASAAAEAATAGPSAEACSARIPGCLLPCPQQLANSWLVGAAAAGTASDTAAAAPAGIMEPQPAATATTAADVDTQVQACATRQGSPPGTGPIMMTATDPSISGASADGHTTSHTQQQQQQQQQEEEDMDGEDDGNSLEGSLEWQPMQLPEPLSGKAALQQQQQGEVSPALSKAEPAGTAGEGASEVPGMLQELDVSLDSLTRLLTGDCPVDTQQPVWMVINLQGKIKGSYTAGKMLEFSRRGTLSSAQLILGIDKDLPYVSRQDLGFYRRLDEVLKAVHAGAVYSPLTQQTVSSRAQQGLAPPAWQPVLPAVTPTPQPAQESAATACGAGDGPGCSMTGSESTSCRHLPAWGDASSGGAAFAAAEAAAAQLQLALQKLCGSSKSSTTAMAVPEGGATSAAGSTAGSPVLLRALSLACSPAPGQDPGSSSNLTASAAAAGAGAATEAAEGGAASKEVAGPQTGTNEEVCSSGEPVWLYINHLGWCRGPFPGEKMVQAHLCGRLPRDTLVVCHNPELPPSLLCMDVAYYFRPFGALLDNVVNGWRYQPVDWLDVSHRGLIKAMQQQQQQQQVIMEPKKLPKPWTPLIWDGPPHEMAPLINPEQLLPPKHVPTMQPLPGAAGATGPWPSSSSGSSGGIKLPRRRRVRPPYRQQQQQQLGLQGYPGPSRQQLGYSRVPDGVHVSMEGWDRAGVGQGRQSLQTGGAAAGGLVLAASEAPNNFGITQQQQQQQQEMNPLQLQAGQQAHLQQHVLLLQVQVQEQQQQQQLKGFMGVSSPGSSSMLSALPTQSHGLAVYPTQNEQQMLLQQQQQQLAAAVSSPAVHQDPPSTWLLQQQHQQQEQQAGTAHLAQQLLLLQSPTQQLHNNHHQHQQQQQQVLSSPQQLAAAFVGCSQPSFQPHSLASSISSTASTLSSQAFSNSSGLSPAGPSLAALAMQTSPAAGALLQAGGVGTSDTFLLQLLLQQQQQQVVPLAGLLTSHPLSANAEACGVEQMLVPSLQGLSMSTGLTGLSAVPQQQQQQQQQQLLAAQLPYQLNGMVQLPQQDPAAQYQHQSYNYPSSQQQQSASLVAAYQQQQDPLAHAQASLQLQPMWQ